MSYIHIAEKPTHAGAHRARPDQSMQWSEEIREYLQKEIVAVLCMSCFSKYLKNAWYVSFSFLLKGPAGEGRVVG